MKKLILLISVCIALNYSLLIQNCFSQWVQVSTGMDNSRIVNDIEICGSFMFAGTWGKGVFRSSDNGSNWIQCPSLGTGRSVKALALMGTTLFAGTENPGRIFRSSNYGASWDSLSSLYRAITSLASSDMYLFAGTLVHPLVGSQIRRSVDSGKTWTSVLYNEAETFGSIAANASNIFAGTGVIFRSTDYGSNWNMTISERALSLIANGSNIYAGTDQHGVYISPNNGMIWQQSGLSNRFIYSLAVYGGNIFAGSTSGYGVYHSSNNGASWVQKNEGFGSVPKINSLLICNGYLFAGTEGQSVWRRPLSDFVGIKPVSNNLPEKFWLFQNYPNPFNPVTKITFALPESGDVKLTLFDILGREVAVLVNEKLSPGTYEVDFDGTNYPSGVYFYKLTTGDFTDTKKMILIK